MQGKRGDHQFQLIMDQREAVVVVLTEVRQPLEGHALMAAGVPVVTGLEERAVVLREYQGLAAVAVAVVLRAVLVALVEAIHLGMPRTV